MKPTVVLAALTVLVPVTAGCRTTSRGSDLKANPVGTGPTQTRPTWIKSPESIEGTIITAWGISMSDKERWKYLQSIYSMLGGTQVLSSKSLVDTPNELFALGLDNLSGWLSGKVLDKEGDLEGQGKEHSFDGLGLSDEDQAGCFADDTKDWCDLKDSVRIDSLSKAGIDPKATLTKEWKKRLMHNVQDIGEFMLLAVDNTLKMTGSERHAADYLVSEVFLPSFPGGGPATAAQEKMAWKNVVYTILMSGGFYLEAPPQTNGSEIPSTAPNPQATNPPATNPPATNPPATNPPVTSPPTTEPPATNPPATNPPPTATPAMDPPANNPPAGTPPVQPPTEAPTP